jgi:hypothetical protein
MPEDRYGSESFLDFLERLLFACAPVKLTLFPAPLHPLKLVYKWLDDFRVVLNEPTIEIGEP